LVTAHILDEQRMRDSQVEQKSPGGELSERVLALLVALGSRA
jgi:hypothetical protein